MKTALFVDFDNVFSGLRRLGGSCAERFALRPALWMRWLVDGLPLPPHAAGAGHRRILVRRCYLNPVVFRQFRRGFSQAGFDIVDCPPMTSAGKTSTDIHMVLDIMEALQHGAHYDEFMVFSADADFSPVLRKLRCDDRRTTVFAAGSVSAAYESSADLMIDADAFIRDALGFGEDEERAGAAVDAAAAQSGHGRVPSDARPADGEPAPTEAADPVGTAEPPQPSGPADVAGIDAAPRDEAAAPASGDPARHGAVSAADRMHSARELILAEVGRAHRPVSCAFLAQLVRDRAVDIGPQWSGHGSFRSFLQSLPLDGLRAEWSRHGGVLYDPARHAVAAADEPETSYPQPSPSESPAPWPTVLPMLGAAQLPALPPRRYGRLVAALAQALAEADFSLIDTGKRVRDLCAEGDEPVSRRDVNQLLRSLLYGGFDPAVDDADAASLTAALCGIVLAACARESLAVDDAMRLALLQWIGGAEAPPEAASAQPVEG